MKFKIISNPDIPPPTRATDTFLSPGHIHTCKPYTLCKRVRNVDMDMKEQVLNALRAAGRPLGVNSIARATDIPVSTLQRALPKMGLLKTADRKWTEPGQSNDIVLNVIDGIKRDLDIVARVYITSHPVAAVTIVETYEDIRMKRVHKRHSEIESAIRQYKDEFTDVDYEILSNVDWLEITIQEGWSKIGKILDIEVTEIISGDRVELTDSTTIELLRKYDKRTTRTDT
jgi:hypothetical protein